MTQKRRHSRRAVVTRSGVDDLLQQGALNALVFRLIRKRGKAAPGCPPQSDACVPLRRGRALFLQPADERARRWRHPPARWSPHRRVSPGCEVVFGGWGNRRGRLGLRASSPRSDTRLRLVPHGSPHSASSSATGRPSSDARWSSTSLSVAPQFAPRSVGPPGLAALADRSLRSIRLSLIGDRVQCCVIQFYSDAVATFLVTLR